MVYNEANGKNLPCNHHSPFLLMIWRRNRQCSPLMWDRGHSRHRGLLVDVLCKQHLKTVMIFRTRRADRRTVSASKLKKRNHWLSGNAYLNELMSNVPQANPSYADMFTKIRLSSLIDVSKHCDYPIKRICDGNPRSAEKAFFAFHRHDHVVSIKTSLWNNGTNLSSYPSRMRFAGFEDRYADWTIYCRLQKSDWSSCCPTEYGEDHVCIRHVRIARRTPVGIFSLEMTRRHCAAHALSSRVERGTTGHDGWHHLCMEKATIRKDYRRPGRHSISKCVPARRLKSEHGWSRSTTCNWEQPGDLDFNHH